MIGKKIGSYEIVEELGRGTSTCSFLARNDRGKKAVAKRLHDQLAGDKAVCERFLGVSELSAKIRMKTYIAVVSGQKSSTEGKFLLREYVEGRPLSEAMLDGTLNKPENYRQVVLGLCDAVRALAMRDVVHGGIHPGNVIVAPDGRIKVTDFGTGLVRLGGKISDSYPLQALRYLSPEQWQGKETTSSADIYSIGLIIAALVNRGIEVFDAGDCQSLETRILKGHDIDCPVLAAAIHPNPSKRYPDIDKFRKGLIEKYFPPDQLKDDSGKDDSGKDDSGKDDSGKDEPVKIPTGVLNAIVDVKTGDKLPLNSPSVLCKVPRNSRIEQRPFQLSNAGPGRLEVLVTCVGSGVSVSPDRLDISSGRSSNLIVNLEPNSDEFINVVFKWNEQEKERAITIKLLRST